MFDLGDTLKRLDGKVTNSFVNLYFASNVDYKDRYGAGRDLKTALSGHADTRHLLVSTQSKPEDVPKRHQKCLAATKCFHFMGSSGLRGFSSRSFSTDPKLEFRAVYT